MAQKAEQVESGPWRKLVDRLGRIGPALTVVAACVGAMGALLSGLAAWRDAKPATAARNARAGAPAVSVAVSEAGGGAASTEKEVPKLPRSRPKVGPRPAASGTLHLKIHGPTPEEFRHGSVDFDSQRLKIPDDGRLVIVAPPELINVKSSVEVHVPGYRVGQITAIATPDSVRGDPYNITLRR